MIKKGYSYRILGPSKLYKFQKIIVLKFLENCAKTLTKVKLKRALPYLHDKLILLQTSNYIILISEKIYCKTVFVWNDGNLLKINKNSN